MPVAQASLILARFTPDEAMSNPQQFEELTRVPQSVDEVIWPDLEPAFHRECLNALHALSEECKACRQVKTSFYVGAGVSVFRPSSLPVANEVLQVLFEECAQSQPNLARQVKSIVESLRQGRYVLMENVFQHLYETIRPHPFDAGRIFDVPNETRRHNINHLFLARWLHSGLGTVVTTNLDPLIEHAWQELYHDKRCELCVVKKPADFDDWFKLFGAPDTLWKLHGSADDPASWGIILSKVGFEVQDARAAFLKHLVQNHNVCFVGYRAADLDLFPPILEAHSSSPKRRGRIFWVFLFHEDRRKLSDYLSREPNIERLFKTGRANVHPIVTTAERLLSWLQTQVFGIEPSIPAKDLPRQSYDYRKWLSSDCEQLDRFGITKLVGYTLRTVGRHDQALQVFDQAAEEIADRQRSPSPLQEDILVQTAHLLQESAQTSWQQKEYHAARTKVERACKHLALTTRELDQAWCEFGRVSMALDSEEGVSPLGRIVAAVRLMRLHRWFCRLERTLAPNRSPLVGQGLCAYYKVKLMERVFGHLRLLQVQMIRSLVLRHLSLAEDLLRKGEFLNSVPDIKRRRALLLARADPSIAVDEMIEAMRIARAVSDSHHELALGRAEELLQLLTDGASRRRLSNFIDSEKSDAG